jgi:hypothetical protein
MGSIRRLHSTLAFFNEIPANFSRFIARQKKTDLQFSPQLYQSRDLLQLLWIFAFLLGCYGLEDGFSQNGERNTVVQDQDDYRCAPEGWRPDAHFYLFYPGRPKRRKYQNQLLQVSFLMESVLDSFPGCKSFLFGYCPNDIAVDIHGTAIGKLVFLRIVSLANYFFSHSFPRSRFCFLKRNSFSSDSFIRSPPPQSQSPPRSARRVRTPACRSAGP